MIIPQKGSAVNKKNAKLWMMPAFVFLYKLGELICKNQAKSFILLLNHNPEYDIIEKAFRVSREMPEK